MPVKANALPVKAKANAGAGPGQLLLGSIGSIAQLQQDKAEAARKRSIEDFLGDGVEADRPGSIYSALAMLPPMQDLIVVAIQSGPSW